MAEFRDGCFMELKKTILGAMLLIFVWGYPGLAQEEEISIEDKEVVEILDILENLEVLQEDLDLMEFLTEVGDNYDG
ncbi:MAG: hypothetical protein KJO34_16905 [Deltaproteobacteria bacterium]|nr:hypothetical protein [Deltaproteobacteria bacterium]